MEHSSLLEMAIRTAKEPWSSVDEKLGALAGLESIGTVDAASALVEVMSLSGLYSKSADRSSMSFPVSGEVAGSAARALGRLDNPASGVHGVAYLMQIVRAKTQPEELRECALYGLGGLSSKSVFQHFTELLPELEGRLLYRLMLTVQESFKRINVASTPYAGAFLVALFDTISGRYSKLDRDVVGIVAKVLADNLPDKGEAEIIGIARQPRRGEESWLAVNVLCSRGKRTPLQEIASILMTSGYPAEIYEEIGARLSVEADTTITTVLNGTSTTKSALSGIMVKFSSKAALSEEARVRVLQRLVSSTNPIAAR